MKPGDLIKIKNPKDESDEKIFGFVLEIVYLEKDRETPMSDGEEVKVLWYTSYEKSKWKTYNGKISNGNSKNLEKIS